MRFSKKSDYALRALLVLADNYKKKPVSIREIAADNDIPRRFLEQIMLDLKDAGIVDAILGRDGGYILARPPKEITMGEVIRHFDGVLAPVGCVSATHYKSCSQESTCRFRRVALEIRNHAAGIMDRMTLASLAKNAPVHEGELNFVGLTLTK